MPDASNPDVKLLPTAKRWGAYTARVENGRVTALEPNPEDPDPSPIGPGMPQAIDDTARIAMPMFRRGWLDGLKAGTPGGDTDLSRGSIASAVETAATNPIQIKVRFISAFPFCVSV